MLLVDAGHLTLTGAGGVVSLQGGAIEGAAGADILENVDQTISGYGTIGVVGTHGALTLDNDAAGIIDADSTAAGHTVLLMNALAQLTNAGILEADGGTLQIENTPVTNSEKLWATGDGTVVLDGQGGSEVVTNTGTVQIDAGATLELQAAKISGGAVTVDGTLDATTGNSEINGGTTITIAATTGTVEATGSALKIDTGVTITNNGTLEADRRIARDRRQCTPMPATSSDGHQHGRSRPRRPSPIPGAQLRWTAVPRSTWRTPRSVVPNARCLRTCRSTDDGASKIIGLTLTIPGHR